MSKERSLLLDNDFHVEVDWDYSTNSDKPYKKTTVEKEGKTVVYFNMDNGDLIKNIKKDFHIK